MGKIGSKEVLDEKTTRLSLHAPFQHVNTVSYPATGLDAVPGVDSVNLSFHFVA
jgi:hypothetical protein